MLFLAAAAVFWYLFATGQQNRWTALSVLTVLIALEATALLSAFDSLWPLALMAGGGFLLRRALGRRHAAEQTKTSSERTSSPSEEPGSR
ncbi:hypothetical protein [Kocuria aegyptia]|uniref:Uncharacterized protein n=1 Tax=Kocuria aegyptia TaxID=330943 RepID=A0ABP4WVY4_9MICC